MSKNCCYFAMLAVSLRRATSHQYCVIYYYLTSPGFCLSDPCLHFSSSTRSPRWPAVQGSCHRHRFWLVRAQTRSSAIWARSQPSRSKACAQVSSLLSRQTSLGQTRPGTPSLGEAVCLIVWLPIGKALFSYSNILLTSCLTISKISFSVKSSEGLSLRFYLLQGNGEPSLLNGLN